MKESIKYSQALTKAMRFCAYQERCIFDLRKKKHEWGLKEEEFAQLLEQLQDENFLNEERFAESYVRGKFHQKKWGKLKIRQGLYSKNIPNSIIEEKIKLIQDKDYKKSIRELLHRKLEQLADDPNKKIKAQRYLFSKGYEMEWVLSFGGIEDTNN